MSHRSAILFSQLAAKKQHSYVDAPESESESHTQEVIDLYIKDINRYSMLTKEQERDYMSRVINEQCQSAREVIIQANLRLVVRIAKRYRYQDHYFMDLIAEGNIGLIHALNKFDPTIGCGFSTYASWWVQQYIETFLMNHSKVIRLPVYVQKKIAKMRKSEKKLTQEYQKNISISELAFESEMNRDELDKMLVFKDLQFISHDCPAHGAEHDEAALDIPDNQGMAQEEIYANAQLRDEVSKYVNMLPEDCCQIIARRFGLIGHDIMSFKHIAVDLNIEVDKARYLYNKGLKYLSKHINKSMYH